MSAYPSRVPAEGPPQDLPVTDPTPDRALHPGPALDDGAAQAVRSHDSLAAARGIAAGVVIGGVLWLLGAALVYLFVG